MPTAILTDFISHDPAYSLCSVVANQVKMLAGQGDLTVFVRKGFPPTDASKVYGLDYGQIVVLDPGETGSNVVNVTDQSDAEIQSLYEQLEEHLRSGSVVLTHDLIYQPNMWKYHVAARRFADAYPETRWMHWVHSATDLGVARQMGRFGQEVMGPFPHSWLVAMHEEEIKRKGTMFGFGRERIVVIPNPLDIMEDYHPLTRQLLGPDAYRLDCLIIYPARLDRGKQVEVIGEIAAVMNNQGWETRVIVLDFHSTAGDKADYRQALKNTHGDYMKFASDFGKESSYRVPHRVVMELMDYADVFVHPSRSESDPLTVPEAMWKRNLMVLNFDLPVFRQYDGQALMGKFSSNVDIATGEPGETKTNYSDRPGYMANLAQAIMHMLKQNTVLLNHRQVRQTRSLEAVANQNLIPAIAGIREWMR